MTSNICKGIQSARSVFDKIADSLSDWVKELAVDDNEITSLNVEHFGVLSV